MTRSRGEGTRTEKATHIALLDSHEKLSNLEVDVRMMNESAIRFAMEQVPSDKSCYQGAVAWLEVCHVSSEGKSH